MVDLCHFEFTDIEENWKKACIVLQQFAFTGSSCRRKVVIVGLIKKSVFLLIDDMYDVSYSPIKKAVNFLTD